MPVNEFLPWHAALWQMLSDRLRRDEVPHALLFSGPIGTGKHALADRFAQALLCEARDDDGFPCGKCRSCQLYTAGNHPDVSKVEPPEEGKIIGIDQVREVSQYLHLKPHYGSFKVVIISPADQMKRAAADGLLKTLEEPNAGSVLILITTCPGLLPATVVSRCQHHKFTLPDREQAMAWLSPRLDPGNDPAALLSWAGGSPLLALSLAGTDISGRRAELLADMQNLARGEVDPVVMAGKLLKNDPKETLFWLRGWVMDMIRLAAGAVPAQVRNRDLVEMLSALASPLDMQTLHTHYGRLEEAERMMGTQLNSQLILERVLIEWVASYAAARRNSEIQAKAGKGV